MSSKEEEFDRTNNNNNNNNNNNSVNNINNNNSDNSSNNNNNYGIFNHRNQNSSAMSKAEIRKSNKPIMEKKRRARINHCLNELKSLILEAMKKDPARHTKLEKADILEMTVKHLQQIQKQQLTMAIQTDPTVIHKFKSGFLECADEVNRYMCQLDGIEPDVRQRLASHLNSCTTNIEQIGTFSTFSNTYRSTSNFPNFNLSTISTPSQLFVNSSQDVNNNARLNMGGVQLIPSRLPTGEIALIMPNSSTIPSSLFMQNFQEHSLPQHQHQPSIDFANTFSRISAFSKPNSNTLSFNHRQTSSQNCTRTTNTSPPLSPVSSISSLGDESSLMQTSSEYTATKTPPPADQHSSGYFSTPQSSESSKIVSRTSHLQQSHVSSTSENSNCLKRSASGDLCADHTAQKLSKYPKLEKNECDESKGSNCDTEENMWRPW